MAMMRAFRLMAGCRPQCAALCSGKSGELPYTAIPGRIQSAFTAALCACRKVAALLLTLRSPGRSRVASSKRAICSAMPLRPSASLKCVMSEISSTCGKAFSRVQAERKRWGAKPSRFMPEFILRKTRCGSCVLCSASMSICSSQCTVCHRCRREHSSRSRASKAPSSNKIGPRQPNARTRSASAKSSRAKPSAPRKPSNTRSMPCP